MHFILRALNYFELAEARLLWPPCVADADIIFCSYGFFLFFLAYSQRSQSGCLPYFHTWCSLSANLECSLKCAALVSLKIQNAKNGQKFAIWAPLHNFVGLYLRN